MKKTLTLVTLTAILTGIAACSAPKKNTENIVSENVKPELTQIASQTIKGSNTGVSILPKAIIYRTSGDYNNYVPVTTNEAATALVTYPAPSDINASLKPISLADGYLLDRRGIAPNTFFTKYTYEEYSRLPQTPSQQQLLQSIMPGAYVTEIVQLPMTVNAAVSDTTLVNKLIRNGLPGCKILWTVPTLKL